jgi:hypothetical protein
LEFILNIIVKKYTYDFDELLSVQTKYQTQNITQFDRYHIDVEYYKNIFEKSREYR